MRYSAKIIDSGKVVLESIALSDINMHLDNFIVIYYIYIGLPYNNVDLCHLRLLNNCVYRLTVVN